MKLARGSRILAMAMLAASQSPLAAAQVGAGAAGGSGAGAAPVEMAGRSPWYGGISIGQSQANIDDARIAAGLRSEGFVTSSITEDSTDTGVKVFGGYQVNRNFAIEGGYFNLGKFGYAATTAAPNAGTLNGTIKLQGLNLDAVGILPMSGGFSVFGRVGLAYAEARDTFTGTGAVVVVNRNPRKSETNYKAGLGLQYDFSPVLGLRVEAERYRINDAIGNKGDVDLLSVGLVYRFGGNR